MAIDPKKTLDAYKARRGEFRILDVPPMQYLMVDGAGDPNTARAYGDAVSALFPLAYSLKFASRDELGVDTVVMPLEGLWHAPDMQAFTSRRDKSVWLWTLMIMVPDHVTPEMFAASVDAVTAKTAKKKQESPALHSVRLETLDEGLCVQTLHVGPYDDEAPVLDELHTRFVPENGLRMTGLHHEIYLSDVRRAAPEKLRTILRQPVEREGDILLG
ncbi:GyrI-like domain-containing protein [Microbacterium sp. ISL-103]|uniref:GyrI-like domain-containing protein n=1 Tax=Microbacterium sp. ISL-103 TaxID=2819156 RepID=UPI001BE52B87|nr:GyrI-like domain-containing protein [Microbacterium sp. ISL-103]MBT2474173.1 GyrI-like domain-containing protein [Microbacterium sp. ISL-103]